ncbi:hypothetical protein ACLOJK_008586 [Asimina triloba]
MAGHAPSVVFWISSSRSQPSDLHLPVAMASLEPPFLIISGLGCNRNVAGNPLPTKTHRHQAGFETARRMLPPRPGITPFVDPLPRQQNPSPQATMAAIFFSVDKIRRRPFMKQPLPARFPARPISHAIKLVMQHVPVLGAYQHALPCQPVHRAQRTKAFRS